MAEFFKRKWQRSYLLVWLVIGLLFLLMELFCRPYGNFPLNDDWSYARVVKTLLDEHRLTTPWAVPIAIPPVLLAALLCSVCGFSFEILRIVTLAFNLVILVAGGYLLKKINVPPSLILLSLLTLLVNPLIFCLSNTFMTDVPALALLLCASVFFWRYFKEARLSDLLAAALLSGCVCLTRQVLIVAPIAFWCACVWGGFQPGQKSGNAGLTVPPAGDSPDSECGNEKSGVAQKWTALLAPSLPALVSAGCIGLHQLWLLHIGGPSFSYRVEQAYLAQQLGQGWLSLSLQFLRSFMIALLYLGLFLLPVLIGALPGLFCQRKKKERVFLLVLICEIVLLVSGGLLWKHSLMPLSDNVLFDLGLGPVILPGAKGPLAAPPFWLLVTVASTAGAGLLVAYLLPLPGVRSWRTLSVALTQRDRLIVFAWCFLALYLAAICLCGFFDRYLIAALPFLMILVLDAAGKNRADRQSGKGLALFVATICCLLFCLFSTVAVHDYFAWNRARWQAWHYLVEQQKIKAPDINGGLEINGWTASDPQTGCGVSTSNTDFSHSDKYCLSLSANAGYEVMAQFPYSCWLAGRSAYVFAERKNIEKDKQF